MSQEELDFGPGPEEDPRGEDPFCPFCRTFVTEDHQHGWIRFKYLKERDRIWAAAAVEQRERDEREAFDRSRKSAVETEEQWWEKIFKPGDQDGTTGDSGSETGPSEDPAPEAR